MKQNLVFKISNAELQKLKSQKYNNYLQYIFYKEYNCLKTETKSTTIISSEMNLVKSFSNQSKKTELKTESWNHFFPYRKTWLCYWVLPFMGLLTSVSKESQLISAYFPFSTLKSGNLVNFGTDFSLSQPNNYSQLNFEIQIPKSLNNLEMFPNYLNHRLNFQTNHFSTLPYVLKNSNYPAISSQIFNEFFDLWIDNSYSIHSNTKSAISKFNNYEQIGQLGLPIFHSNLSLMETNPGQTYPLKYFNVPVETSENENFNSQNLFLSEPRNLKTILFFQKLKNDELKVNKINKKLKLFRSFTKLIMFNQKSVGFKSNNSFFESRNLNNYPMLIGIPMQQKENLYFEKNTLVKQKLKNSNSETNPIKNYKKGTFILDYFYKQILFLKKTQIQEFNKENLSKNEFNNVLSFTNFQINELKNSNPNIKEVSTIFPTKDDLQYYFPNSFDKIIKKNSLLTSFNSNLPLSKDIFQEIKPIVKEQKHQAFFDFDFKSSNSQKKYHFVEKLIKNLTPITTQNLESSLLRRTNQENNDLIKKLTTEQIYSIILNSLTKQINSTIQNQNNSVKLSIHQNDLNDFFANLNSQNQQISILELNHPLIFVNTPKNLENSFNEQKLQNLHSNSEINVFENLKNAKLKSNSFLNPEKTKLFSSSLSPDEKNLLPNYSTYTSVFQQKQTKSEIVKESKKDYFYNYIDYLSFKVRKLIKNKSYQNLNLSSQKLNSLRKDSFTKYSIEPINKTKKIPNKVEKIFRSLLSKKHMLIQTNIKLKKDTKAFSLSNLLIPQKVNLIQSSNISKNFLFKTKLKQKLILENSLIKLKPIFKNSRLNSSINTLLKSRYFILKSAPNRLTMNNALNEVKFESLQNTKMLEQSYFQKLEKRKYFQKKYRRKKQRKETRRRKKRKRFYPRPTWVRFKMYQNILSQLTLPHTYNSSFKSKDNYFSNKEKSLRTNEEQKSKFEFYKRSKNFYIAKNLNSNTIRLGLSPLLQNLPLYSTKDFYQIKTSVIGELKRSFWKSYWLRSNLQPYLNQIKSNLKEMKNLSTQKNLTLNGDNLISLIFGLKPINSFSLGKNILIDSDKHLPSNKWQLIRQISEHNRITYERIQNLILNIRENLNINGKFKARPYKRPGPQKLKSLNSLKGTIANNQNNDFWVKLEKNKIVRSLFQTSYKYYGDYSNYRLLWAINKSNLGSYKPTNKVKDLWTGTKNRDQSKANKTKKILYDVSQTYKSLVDYSDIKQSKFKLNNSINGPFQNKMNQTNFKTQKFMNGSKNQFSTNVKNFFPVSTTDSIISIEKCLKISERKLKQKQQKLTLTIGVNSQNSFNQFKKTNFNETKFQIGNKQLIIPGTLKKFSNEYNYWWNEAPTNQIVILKSSSAFNESNVPVWVSTFLFHFCAIVSLISISQVRELIKFALILSSKISKLYFQFIYFSFNSLYELNKKIQPNPKINYDSMRTITNFYPQGKYNLLFVKPPKFKSTNSQSILHKEKNQNIQFNTKKVEYQKQIKYFSSDLYFIIFSLLKKSFLIYEPFQYQKTKLTSLNTKNSNKISKESPLNENSRIFKKSNKVVQKIKVMQTIIKVLFYSRFTSFIFSLKNFSFLTYTYFIKSLNFVETLVRSVYTFFEKPGELIVDWIAYLFLVEWAADLTTTIPDTIDTGFFYSVNKYSRLSRFPINYTTNITGNFIANFSSGIGAVGLSPSISTQSAFSLNQSLDNQLSTFPVFFFVGGLIQRRIMTMYEIFLNIACRPDTDILIRQQKGQVFWDLWSDLLIEVAEQSNINISELSNLKEEQNRLLQQLLVVTKSNISGSFKPKSSDSNHVLIKPNLDVFGQVILKPLEFTRLKNQISKLNLQNDSLSFSLWKRWSTNQFLSYQGKDTELFIDLHPPKSFSSLTSIKYSQSIQQPIGLVLCQIFSGVFYKQIAKNLLIIGPPGTDKSMLIQAIAGETELKIITDNAYRYAMVFRGVAVGIKLLRDVFEALTLHTPCIFLLEDIHAIGERRPLLISDDENTKGTESSFSTEREEVHEKNQVIYQLTKHIISHYKKPYKGDFSLLIPTNHFCFDLFNSSTFNEKRVPSTLSQLTPISFTIKSTTELIDNSQQTKNKGSVSPNENFVIDSTQKKLPSSLLLEKNQLLAPPATSPFSVLILKEEKKFKPKKVVKELPWSGLPGEQYANISKSTYSIRVKVALLADSVLSNLSVKLDMITDLLVIIDSVKGNRGFVVFATTHIPYILDPALRRPGRFDETLSLPQIPSLLSRWDNLKSNLSIWQTLNSNQTKLSINPSLDPFSKNIKFKSSPSSLNYGEPFSVYPIGVSISLWQSNLLKTIYTQIPNSYSQINLAKSKTLYSILVSNQSSLNLKNSKSSQTLLNQNSLKIQKLNQLNLQKIYNIVSKILLTLQLSYNSNVTDLGKIKQWGDFSLSLGTVNFLSLAIQNQSLLNSTINRVVNVDSLVYMSLYSSPHIFKQHLTILMAGQIGETFVKSFGLQNKNPNLISSLKKTITQKGFEPSISNTWKTATSLIFAFIQKRIIYQTKLIVPKFLDFGPEGTKMNVPSPPGSNILLPAKRYENYKRTFTFSELKYKTQLSISDKIQLHQQQRLVKRLYKVPLKEYFKSEILNTFKESINHQTNNLNSNYSNSNSNNTNLTTFSNASIILGPLEKSLTKPTSINWYFRNRILNRHQTYLSNQWWNGQLQEHNTESTFLSDIDWRYSYFISKSNTSDFGDLFIDFPDSEQYYNPKNQRWINTCGSLNSWFDMEKSIYYNSSYHYMFECLIDAFKYLDQNRELLDFYVINIFEKGINLNKEFNETELLDIFKRFSGFLDQD